jgi:transcriptional regulator with PAS, ATPase and Fis domain
MNDKAEDVLEMDKNFAKGRNITEIIPNSEMPNILEKGEITFSKTFDYKNKKLLVNRIPLKRNDRIIGAVCSFRDISDYSNIKEQLTSEKTEKEILKTIFEIAYDGLVVIDPEGYITMMSNAYKKFLGFENEEVIGRHVADVIENTRLHIVANTGVAEIADLQKVNEGYMIASRIPVFENGKVACVVGKVMFRNIGELDDIYSKINKIEQELEDYKDELTQINKARYNFSNIVGGSKEIKEVISLAKKAAYTNSSVLILGESGTGKELFAHSIHNSSARRNKPFIKVNCAAIPNELLESELFGYEQGAFTGAKKGGKIGKFEVADQGTIFLDEIADMPFHMQAKILRVIQEREIERIGSNTPKRIDVRIIAATNRNIEKMIDENKFRLDLYYRLNVVTLDIPALRERIGDVEELCKNFIEKYRVRYLKKVDGINENALLKLRRYNWPGNIRELENMIERAINIMDEDTVIKPKHLPLDVSERYDPEEIKTLKETVEEAEKRAIVTALDSVKGNKSKASKILGISRTALYEKIERYKLGSVM